MNEEKICKYHHSIDGSSISLLFFDSSTMEENMLFTGATHITISVKEDYSFFIYYETDYSSQKMKSIRLNAKDKLIISCDNEIIANLNGQTYDIPLSIPTMRKSSAAEMHKLDLASLFDNLDMNHVY